MFFLGNQFKNLIFDIYEKNKDYENNIMNFSPRIKIGSRVTTELLPLIIVALMFTSLFAYTLNSRTTGDLYFKIYKIQLSNNFEKKQYKDIEDIENVLDDLYSQDKDVTKFIIKDENFYRTEDNIELSDFFVKYALIHKDTNRTYDYYCIDREGTFVKINTLDGNEYLVGVTYKTNSNIFFVTLFISSSVLFIIIFITLLFIANNLSKDINTINNGFITILKRKNFNKLIATSNDETGKLTDSFNKIQEMTQENIKELNEKQELIIRQEKLSILGEMAGGMAHDINNPASAINMSINVLYNIDDNEKKKEILDNMKECTKRILTIVSSVRDQFRNMGDTTKEEFSLNSVLKNIEIVIHNQLVKYKCTLNIDYSKDFKIFGEKNKLNQVLSNIIMNSILAYRDNNINGEINIDIDSDKEYNIISIKDKALRNF